MAKLLLKFDSAIIGQFDIKKNVTTFGRKPDNDIVIDHPAVSGSHGKITKEGTQYFVEDVGSTNGTILGGRKIKKSRLSDKDNIRVAKHVLEFLMEAPPPEETTPPASPPADASFKAPAPTDPLPRDASKPLDIGVSPSDATTDKAAQKELLRKSLGLPPTPAPEGTPPTRAPSKMDKFTTDPPQPTGPVGVIKVIAGAVGDQTEFQLKDLVTYIGSSDQAIIKIKGFMAPGLAAAISRRSDGYFLKAVKSGYPKVNGTPIKEQTLLESGALIECGGTNMAFYLNDEKKNK